eukprot:1159070-Pelagomonas_calceolata.AAC.13
MGTALVIVLCQSFLQGDLETTQAYTTIENPSSICIKLQCDTCSILGELSNSMHASPSPFPCTLQMARSRSDSRQCKFPHIQCKLPHIRTWNSFPYLTHDAYNCEGCRADVVAQQVARMRHTKAHSARQQQREQSLHGAANMHVRWHGPWTGSA